MLEKINVNALDIEVGARKDILEDVKSQFYWMIVFHLKNSRNVAGGAPSGRRAHFLIPPVNWGPQRAAQMPGISKTLQKALMCGHGWEPQPKSPVTQVWTKDQQHRSHLGAGQKTDSQLPILLNENLIPHPCWTPNSVVWEPLPLSAGVTKGCFPFWVKSLYQKWKQIM